MSPVTTKLALFTLLTAALFVPVVKSDEPANPGAKATLLSQHELPNAPGKSLKAVLVEYEPGGANPSHTHAPSAFIYATVLEGAVKSQVNGGELRTYQKGESFVELPGSFHNVSANASSTAPAKLLAVFVVDTHDGPLTKPAHQH